MSEPGTYVRAADRCLDTHDCDGIAPCQACVDTEADFELMAQREGDRQRIATLEAENARLQSTLADAMSEHEALQVKNARLRDRERIATHIMACLTVACGAEYQEVADMAHDAVQAANALVAALAHRAEPDGEEGGPRG